MTAPTAYTTLDSDDLGANKILRAATMSALDSNPVAIAQRGTGAPWLNGIGAIEAITSGSGNYTVPDGAYRVKATVVGGGGGGGGSSGNGSAGGSTTFGPITCTGGGGGTGSSSAAGSGSGGYINIRGGDGCYTFGGSTPVGFGGASKTGGSTASAGSGYGAGGGPGDTTRFGGAAGGYSIDILSVEPGDLIAYSVGAGGGAGTGSPAGGAGAGGIIILEY